MSKIGKVRFSRIFHIYQVIFSINGIGPALELNCQNISMNTQELSEHSEMVIGNYSLENVYFFLVILPCFRQKPGLCRTMLL